MKQPQKVPGTDPKKMPAPKTTGEAGIIYPPGHPWSPAIVTAPVPLTAPALAPRVIDNGVRNPF
ncbi:MAG: hypothetical protein L0Y71_14255 [Gemmataceae bacterium]|nr:hypothetical protein [Gemmataceae bacterium]